MELPFRAPPRFRTVLAILLLVLCALLPAFRTARTALAAPLDGRTIVVGGDQDYPPYEFLGPDGAPTGYNVDLTRAIAEVMGFPVQIRLGRWSDIRKALEKGEIDAIHGMFRSPEREAVVDFSIPHSVVAHAIIVRKDSPPIHSVDDLRGKQIIVMDGDIMHDFVLSQHLTDSIYPVETQADALRLLSSGQHDCVLAARQPSLYWMRKLKLDNLIVTGPPLAPSEYCYAVKKGDTRLLAAINRGLSILQRTGRYQQIEQAWLGVLDDRSQALRRTAKKLTMGLGAALAVLLAILAWNRSLRRQVAARMQETEAARAALAEQAALAGALAGLFRELLTVTDMGNAAALILDKARTLTHSPYGCVGRVDPATGRLIASSSARNIPGDQPLQENALPCASSAGLPAGR